MGIFHHNSLLPRFWRVLPEAHRLPLGLWALLNLYAVVERGLPLWLWLAQVPFVAALSAWPQLRVRNRLAGFALKARKFDTHQFFLCYHADLADQIDPAEHVRQWEQRLAELTEELGPPTKLPINVLLLPTASDLSRMLDRSLGAMALNGTIAAGYDLLEEEDEARETMRHELTHLLSAGWGPRTPAFKVEGLAVWAQQTSEGKPLDFRALTALLGNKTVPLWHLLAPAAFDEDREYSYILAGSFTEFLLRTYGWRLYREFYRNADADNYETVFDHTFEISLEAAERRWRRELLAREQEFGNELSVAVQERRARTAYRSWQYAQCLNEVAALDQLGRASPYILWISASIYTFRGDYRQAEQALRRVLDSEEAWVESCRAVAWLQLGELCDLLGERDQAVSAYRRCLSFPDDPHDEEGAPHERARARLVKPFTEPELLRRTRDRWARGSGSR